MVLIIIIFNKMKLNNIQTQIYIEYKINNKVWADCPRQCGKTELLVYIAIEELKNHNRILYKAPTEGMKKLFYERLIKELENESIHLLKYILKDELIRNVPDVILYDEIYFDLLNNDNIHCPEKIICLRTKLHKTLYFNYQDMEEETQKYIKLHKKFMSEEQFKIEFNNN